MFALEGQCCLSTHQKKWELPRCSDLAQVVLIHLQRRQQPSQSFPVQAPAWRTHWILWGGREGQDQSSLAWRGSHCGPNGSTLTGHSSVDGTSPGEPGKANQEGFWWCCSCPGSQCPPPRHGCCPSLFPSLSCSPHFHPSLYPVPPHAARSDTRPLVRATGTSEATAPISNCWWWQLHPISNGLKGCCASGTLFLAMPAPHRLGCESGHSTLPRSSHRMDLSI